jgi:hypothetical protein
MTTRRKGSSQRVSYACCRLRASKTQLLARPMGTTAKNVSNLTLDGVLAAAPIQGSRAVGLAARSIATSHMSRTALRTFSATARHHQTKTTVT